MNILRLAWSSYQTPETLAREEKSIEQLGFRYYRADNNGEFPGNPSDFPVLIINSQFVIDRKFLEQWPTGKLVITASSGYDNIDLAACEQRKITVARLAGARAQRVAKHTQALTLALLRDIPICHNRLTTGDWDRKNSFNRVRDPQNETAGVIGYGLIGERVTNYFQNIFKNPVLVCDPLKEKTTADNKEFQFCSLKKLLREASIISLHADLNFSTRELINKKTISLMKDKVMLINSARGQMINHNDLLGGLNSGKISSAGLDVFPKEPPDESIALNHERLLLTPHAAGFGPGLLNDLQEELVKLLKKWQSGKPLSEEVTPLTPQQKELLAATCHYAPCD